MKISRRILSYLLFCSISAQFGLTDAIGREATAVDRKKNQLIGYMIDKQLPAMHFSSKIVDDNLAK